MGPSVRGKGGSLWVRIVFNCFNFYSIDEKNVATFVYGKKQNQVVLFRAVIT